ncbi:type II CAAX endopeptidase family protein [Flavobacterium paronense]|uniref:Lysostaphin resistance A-like protein n=1 Tax=Flavobacterium paronense TaxID=1392775 RepID=A0ABV5GG28_9FLAO|nr:type II CAAX endopeptidase family protein [Flavobacterium paronense]MDN3675770.1 type II CAAX endopeptidase family protein [Flavobacterium paronense]MDN3675777.1 type II CAAX endopeptidase family protein [Flavobacterium paronense]MDN3676970.1 type II CAAX endopeptidase family protein [Flavobacterium paronense]
MFLENGFLPTNKFWKYLVGSLIIFIASAIGQIPWVIAVFIKSLKTGKPFPTKEMEMMNFLNLNTTLFLLLFSFVVAFIAIILVIKYFHKQTLLSITTSRVKVDWKRIFFSFTLWGVFTVGSTLIMFYTSPGDFVYNFKPFPFLILAIIGILLIPVQTSTEEYVFRGYLMQGFALLAKNRWFPLVMTSVIFGTMHIANPEVEKMGYIILVYYIGTGFFLGVITLMDEGMELALGFHAANNLMTALLVTSDWSAFQTNSIFKDISSPSAGFEILVPVLIIFPLLLFIFSKKYNWTDWKEKLTGKIIVVEKNEQIENIVNDKSYE